MNPKTKKNNQQIKYKKCRVGNSIKQTPYISQGDAYLQYEKDAGWFIKKPRTPIDVPVNVMCIFYRENDRRCDLTNLLEAIDDILVKYGVIKDDNFKILVSHDGSRVRVDKSNPRTEIFITTVDIDKT